MVITDYSQSVFACMRVGALPLLGRYQIPVALRLHFCRSRGLLGLCRDGGGDSVARLGAGLGRDLGRRRDELVRPFVLGREYLMKDVSTLFRLPDQEPAAFVGIGLFAVFLDGL